MSRARHRRMARLEKLAAPVIAERKRKQAEEEAWMRRAAREHATKLVTVILHGDPQIEEPLGVAWDRALSRLGLTGVPEPQLPRLLRARVIQALPGETENDKFEYVFHSAPRWLLQFCLACMDCFVLGIDLPDNSEPPYEPGRDALHEVEAWPNLPTGTLGAGGPFEPEPLPDIEGNPFAVLTPEELVEYSELLFDKDRKKWSRRERRRFNEIVNKVWSLNGDKQPSTLRPVRRA